MLVWMWLSHGCIVQPGLAFNASLVLLGILAIKRIPDFAADLSASSDTALRHLLDTALEILDGLDGGNETITRCRAALAQLVSELDHNGTYIHYLK